MSDSRFVYVTFIRATPQQVWDALTKPEFIEKYWLGAHHESDWRQGSSWKIVLADGQVADSGEVLEIDPPRKLVLKWRNEWKPEAKADGYTRCTYLVEDDNGLAKLTVTHEADGPHKLIPLVAGGWPRILSNLKSLLETGQPLQMEKVK